MDNTNQQDLSNQELDILIAMATEINSQVIKVLIDISELEGSIKTPSLSMNQNPNTSPYAKGYVAHCEIPNDNADYGKSGESGESGPRGSGTGRVNNRAFVTRTENIITSIKLIFHKLRELTDLNNRYLEKNSNGLFPPPNQKNTDLSRAFINLAHKASETQFITCVNNVISMSDKLLDFLDLFYTCANTDWAQSSDLRASKEGDKTKKRILSFLSRVDIEVVYVISLHAYYARYFTTTSNPMSRISKWNNLENAKNRAVIKQKFMGSFKETQSIRSVQSSACVIC